MKIYCDGSGWNGQRSRFAVACENGKNKIITFTDNRTNNEMEYMAVLYALEHFAGSGDKILTDSQLVVNQVNGNWKVKQAHLFEFCQTAKTALDEKGCALTWIPREENMAGHLLEGG